MLVLNLNSYLLTKASQKVEQNRMMVIRAGSGFTLVELLIVVFILAILAAVIIPQFSTTSSEAKESVLKSNLSMLRGTIELYMSQHNDIYPGKIGGIPGNSWNDFVAQLIGQTDQDGNPGTDYGPYLRSIPLNPINNLKTGKMVSFPQIPDDSSGWYYEQNTGEIRANASGTAPSGINYIDL
jgi:prepilin-type N-terminal cleavage/methylation domain-containing protein